MTNDNYTQITWQEVRKGDVLFHGNGDRLTVESADRTSFTGRTFRVTVATRGFGTDELERIGFTPYRRKSEMPTQPGTYLDKDGDVWAHENNGTDKTWRYGRNGFLYSDQDAARHAPFTRLVPMPTEEQVRKALFEADVKARLSVSDATAAVMALLNGEVDGE